MTTAMSFVFIDTTDTLFLTSLFDNNGPNIFVTGVEPMGLFWSLKCLSAPNQSARLVKKDVSTPLKFNIKVYAGIKDLPIECDVPMAETKIERLYKKPGVKRIQLTGKFKGAVFIPEGRY